jgi:hypothetical protein
VHSDAHEHCQLKRQAMVERPGRCPVTLPAQCCVPVARSRCDRSSCCCSAAAAADLDPVPKIAPPLSVTTEPRSWRRDIETGARICAPDLSASGISPVLTMVLTWLAFDLPCWKLRQFRASCPTTREEFSGARVHTRHVTQRSSHFQYLDSTLKIIFKF